MKFEEILPFLRDGKKITHYNWKKYHYIYLYEDDFKYELHDEDGKFYGLTASQIMQAGWKIFDEEKGLQDKFEFTGWACEPEEPKGIEEENPDGVRFYDCEPNENIPRSGKWKITMARI